MSDNLDQAGDRHTEQIQSAILKKDTGFVQGTNSKKLTSRAYASTGNMSTKIIQPRSSPASTQLLLIACASVSRPASCLSDRNARKP